MTAPVVASSVKSYSTASVTTFVMTAPSGIQSGDLLVASFMVNGTSIATTPPDGTWAEILDGAGSISHHVYLKTAGGSEPGTYSFTTASGRRWGGGIARIPAAALDAVSALSTGSGTTPTTNSVTTLGADRLLLALIANGDGTDTNDITPPSGFTELWDAVGLASSYPHQEVSWNTQASAGASGTKVASSVASAGWSALLVAIKSASSPTSAATLHIGLALSAGAVRRQTSAATITLGHTLSAGAVRRQATAATLNIGHALTAAAARRQTTGATLNLGHALTAANTRQQTVGAALGIGLGLTAADAHRQATAAQIGLVLILAAAASNPDQVLRNITVVATLGDRRWTGQLGDKRWTATLGAT